MSAPMESVHKETCVLKMSRFAVQGVLTVACMRYKLLFLEGFRNVIKRFRRDVVVFVLLHNLETAADSMRAVDCEDSWGQSGMIR